MKKFNKDLNAIVTLTSRDVALKKAQNTAERIAKGNRLSILDGIPIAVKDNFCTKGIRTTCASR